MRFKSSLTWLDWRTSSLDLLTKLASLVVIPKGGCDLLPQTWFEIFDGGYETWRWPFFLS